MSQPSHNDLILDQFTRQATPFSTASPITDAAALKLIVETSSAKAADSVLDVACGGGVVACAFAPCVKHVTGIDMTPAMLARSAEYAKKLGLTNLTWRQGDVTSLPFKDGAFGKRAFQQIAHGVAELVLRFRRCRQLDFRKRLFNSGSDMQRTCDGSRSFSSLFQVAAFTGSAEAYMSHTTTRPPTAQTRTISFSTVSGPEHHGPAAQPPHTPVRRALRQAWELNDAAQPCAAHGTGGAQGPIK